ncbi:MAG: ATP-binding protein [Beijerinckiaceae bacterium]
MMALFRRRAGPMSIAARLVLSAILLSAVILLVAGLLLSTFYRRTTELGFDERLNVYLKALVADVAGFGESDRTEPGSLGEPRFELPLSGWYWQIARIDTERDSEQQVRTSKSLFASRLPRLSDLGVRTRREGVAEAYAVGPDGRDIRLIERLIDLGDDGRYLVTVAGDPEEIIREIRQFNFALVGTFAILGLALAGVSLAQVRFGLGPLANLRGAVNQIRRGEVQRVEGSFPPEIAPLADELNLLVDANHEIVERARTHVGNLAHALKTPISVIVNEADADQTPLAAKVREQTAVMRQQVQYHLDRARAAARAAAVGSVTEVEPVVASMVRTFTKIQQARGVVFASSVEDGARFRGEKQDLEEMLGNLVDNAGKWAKSAVRIGVERGADIAPERPGLVFTIDDDGPGLAPEKRQEAIRRGRRLDESVPGSGLGLSIVVDLAQLYGGSVALEDSLMGGLRARLVLPAVTG